MLCLETNQPHEEGIGRRTCKKCGAFRSREYRKTARGQEIQKLRWQRDKAKNKIAKNSID